ncbi:MAG: preprotein translocase subunit YajC [Micrococcales bacterium]|nr:preprotein translocase subunit YajC [Micrococcales bacterium]
MELAQLAMLAVPFVLLLGLMMLSRRRQREIAQVQSSLTPGDEVMTTSGLHGRVASIDGDVVALEVAPGTVLRFDRRAIATRGAAGPTH